MFRRIRTIIAAAALAFAAAAGAQAEPPYPIEWMRQLGSSDGDFSRGVATDEQGNAFIAGQTYGDLGGPNPFWDAAFVSKYDASGGLLWTRQLGTPEPDVSRGVATDHLGNVFIGGRTRGSIGGPNAGDWDAFVSKYDSSGNLLWARQLGTAKTDGCLGVAADHLGNVVIVGYTCGSLGGPNLGASDAFVAKYGSTGNLLWVRQLGTLEDDPGFGVATDRQGDIFISGGTDGSLGGPNAGRRDAFLGKYDSSGNLLWTRQLGTRQMEECFSAAADDTGHVFISGYTSGGLAGPMAGMDAFVSKYDSSGSLVWTRQLGTSEVELSRAVAADHFGNVIIAGTTGGSLGGPNAGSYDAFVSMYDASGSLLWTRQFGTPAEDESYAAAVDGAGNVFITGDTAGSLGGPNAGGPYDPFLVKLTVPEPSVILIVTAAGLPMLLKRRRNA